MTKERAWPVKAMYILIAAALAIGLMIMAAPAQKVSAVDDEVISEWERVPTPTTEDWVLAPESVIIDYALASDGEVAYAIVDSYYGVDGDYFLLRSDDYGATWEDITDDDWAGLDFWQVATDWVDPDFVAIAVGNLTAQAIYVYVSTDGGDTFEDEPGEVEDEGVSLVYVSDLAVSPEAADKRDIAVGGAYCCPTAALFRCTVDGDSIGGWELATDVAGYPGWDNEWTGHTDDIHSDLITDIIFSPNWATDKTVLVTTVELGDVPDGIAFYSHVYLQCGTWGTTEGWNEKSTLGIEAVPILEDVTIPLWLAEEYDARGIAGMALPSDYNSKTTSTRILWVWVNYLVGTGPYIPACAIMRVEDDSADPVGPLGQVEDGELWLTNISYQGTIAQGEAIAGVLGTGTYEESPVDLLTECCEGVQVYRNGGIKSMDVCCERWHKACKPPTGIAGMAVSYVGEDKAYAVALWGEPSSDEGAWSVTFDDGNTWNQLSLIDTYICYLSDVAVSPDCNKTFLVSVNIEKVRISYCGCDSVWLKATNLPEAEEYSGKWLRTWSGLLTGNNTERYGPHYERGLLRLAPEETTGDTVYLFDRMSSNVYRNDLETLGCWDPMGSTELDEIVDLAAKDADTLFALDYDGDVAMFAEDEWQEAVDSEVDPAYTIAVWGDSILVGGDNEDEPADVSYSDDGGETFALLEGEEPTISGLVTLAFDTYFDTNKVIYAATALAEETGVYRWVMNETDEWKDLRAEPDYDYTGLVVDRPGNPFTSAETGGVIYASYVGERCLNSTCWSGDKCWYTGVARRLYPAEEKICGVCGEWDYLTVGLTDDEHFIMTPDPLEICGCLSPDTNSKLFAIGMVYGEQDGGCFYDMEEAQWGTVWTFEDCYAKKAPEITSPADGAVIPADPCSCYSVPFTILWDRLCDACSFDIQFALDEEFDMPVEVNGLSPEELIDLVISGDNPSFSISGGEAGGLSCETTYYVKVRAANAENCQIIHSWWSAPIEFTIAPSVEAGIITLVAPAPGALNQPTKNVGFSWDLEATADAFDWVLSKNADLSSPLSSKNLTGKATSYANTLDHGTTYYWQVKAYNEGALIGVSSVGTFTTGATGAFCSAIDGMCFDTKAELEAHNADLSKPAATPFWVWVVIAIGAVLVIVVIVLIFRTRRV